MQESTEEIRRKLLQYGKCFLASNCQYNNQENPAVENMLKMVQPPVQKYEQFNQRHLDHGQSPQVNY